MTLLDSLEVAHENRLATFAQQKLGLLVQDEQYVGEVFSMGYETATVIIHDYYRKQVGGVPGLSFLIATRINPKTLFDYRSEDSSVLLLRVLDAAPLPNQSEMERIRAEAAQRASGEPAHWDEAGIMDGYTQSQLSYAGLRCRIIGTFYLDQAENTEGLILKFGADISNYYPNRGLKVYKPRDEALAAIVNFRDPSRVLLHPLSHLEVEVGEVRYASTNRAFQGVANVPVKIAPADLVDQKTALFGMTRSGKSNTAKVIAKSVFELRFTDLIQGRIGQLIFDYNGEYANENVQDARGGTNPTALKNVWRVNHMGQQQDVVTYGSVAHPNDPNRKLTKLNFFADLNIQIGKEIINSVLEGRSDKYLNNFKDVIFKLEDPNNRSESTRYNRCVLAYRALLAKAGFPLPQSIRQAQISRLFNQELRDALAGSQDDPNGEHAQAARILSQASISWAQAAAALTALHDFISRGSRTGYNQFNSQYQSEHDGNSWDDQNFRRIIGMFEYSNGPALVARVSEQHSATVGTDYTDEIYGDLVAGRLVIIDQSAGNPEINQAAARRIMTRIFMGNLEAFTRAQTPTKILIYIEEAHNLLPSSKETDLQDIWVRTAKEGAKMGIGLVYSTQEVSSIQKNILKATSNWFISHLNNTEETRELNKYYDFSDFEQSILRAQDKGFLRVKTLSNSFVVPTQIHLFEVIHAI